MNTAVATRPSIKRQRVDHVYTCRLNDYGWRVRFGYHITQYGRKSSRLFMGGDPYNDGIPFEVCITRAWLVNETETVEQAVPLSIFTTDQLIEHETEIGQSLDDEL